MDDTPTQSKNGDGGPAFPSQDGGGRHWPGASLRDWFAGQALAALVEDPHSWFHGNKKSVNVHEVAGIAYELADAMLAARSDGKAGAA